MEQLHLAGHKIRQWREASGLSAEQLGERLDPKGIVSRHTVYGWEQRGKVAKPPMQRRLADMGICAADDWLRPAPAEAPPAVPERPSAASVAAG